MNFHFLSMKSVNLGLVPVHFSLSHHMVSAIGGKVCAVNTCSVRSINTFFLKKNKISFSIELSAFSCRVPLLQSP